LSGYLGKKLVLAVEKCEDKQLISLALKIAGA